MSAVVVGEGSRDSVGVNERLLLVVADNESEGDREKEGTKNEGEVDKAM